MKKMKVNEMGKKNYKLQCGMGLHCFVFGAKSYKEAIEITEKRIAERWGQNEVAKQVELAWLHKFNTKENAVIIPDGDARIVFTPIC